MKKVVLISLFFFFFQKSYAEVLQEKPIVVLIASYNNAKWYKCNLDSALNQNYSNYRVIYVDDCSPDGTGQLVKKYIEKNGWQDRVTLVQNKSRKLKMENFYNSVHKYCEDYEIVIDLDGDDWWVDEYVLALINEAYADPDVWMTYGSYVGWPDPLVGGCEAIPAWVIVQNAYRSYQWVTSQQRTFYAWLFKKINPEDLKYDGNFLDMTADLAYMFPMLEMAGGRFKYITETLYVYNRANPINDNKQNIFRQLLLDGYLRGMKPYKKLSSRGEYVF